MCEERVAAAAPENRATVTNQCEAERDMLIMECYKDHYQLVEELLLKLEGK